MMLAMNAIGYDAMVVGNHEFNFGLKNLAKARAGRAISLDLVEHSLQPGATSSPSRRIS